MPPTDVNPWGKGSGWSEPMGKGVRMDVNHQPGGQGGRVGVNQEF